MEVVEKGTRGEVGEESCGLSEGCVCFSEGNGIRLSIGRVRSIDERNIHCLDYSRKKKEKFVYLSPESFEVKCGVRL